VHRLGNVFELTSDFATRIRLFVRLVVGGTEGGWARLKSGPAAEFFATFRQGLAGCRSLRSLDVNLTSINLVFTIT
jgi:hypothetical protein